MCSHTNIFSTRSFYPKISRVMGKTRDVAGGAVETAALIKLDYCTCALESKIFGRCSRIKTVF